MIKITSNISRLHSDLLAYKTASTFNLKNDIELSEERTKLAAGLLQAAQGLAYSPFGKGLATAAGAAFPTYMVGSALSNKFTSDARDKALQTGMGLATIGGTMYGIHHMFNKPSNTEVKLAEDWQTELAAMGYADYILKEAEISALTDEATKLAAEVRKQNYDAIVSLLSKVID